MVAPPLLSVNLSLSHPTTCKIQRASKKELYNYLRLLGPKVSCRQKPLFDIDGGDIASTHKISHGPLWQGGTQNIKLTLATIRSSSVISPPFAQMDEFAVVCFVPPQYSTSSEIASLSVDIILP